MSIKTQGTQIYFIDPADDSVVKVGCPTGADISGRSKEDIDDTCLEADDRTFKAGLRNPGSFAMPINIDPADATHVRLIELDESGDSLKWAVGLSDGKDIPPTVNSVGEFVLPTTRSWRDFEGYIQEFSESYSANSVITAQLAIKISGAVTFTSKA